MIRDDIVLTLCYPDTELKLELLRKLIKDVRSASLPVILATHLFVPKDIVESVDFFVYSKEEVLSHNYDVYYHFVVPGEVSIRTKREAPYHALAGHMSMKEALTFLRNKFKRVHYIQYDTLVRIPEYVSAMKKILEKYNYVSVEYSVPDQNLKGICGTFFSANIRWYDYNYPEISTWDEWVAQGRDGNDNLLGENWEHNYLTDHGLIPSCYFLKPEETKEYILDTKVKTLGGKEPGLQAYISELEDHRIILFVHLYSAGTLSFIIERNGETRLMSLDSGVLYWEVMDKQPWSIRIKSKEQELGFIIEPWKEYTNTIFNFNDNRLRCLKHII
jgi:hypothetical protein